MDEPGRRQPGAEAEKRALVETGAAASAMAAQPAASATILATMASSSLPMASRSGT